MRTLVIIGMLLLAGGCSGLQLDSATVNKDVVAYTVESLAVPIGYYAASNEIIDTALREAYSLATEGKLTVDGVNKILDAVGTEDPLQIILVKRAIRLLEMVGAQIDPGTSLVTSIDGLDIELIRAAAKGYVDGFDTYKITHD